jgi:hypothetical protein
MGMTNTITIQKIFTRNEPIVGEIVNVGFIFTLSDESHSAGVYGEVRLNQADADNFIALNSTTEEMVVQWVKDALGDKLADYERIAQERIDAQKNPLVATSLPWVKEEVIEPISLPPTRTGNAYP